LRIAHEPLEKVTVFVTRGTADARELLVFRHPMGGVQLPAGTIEQNEPAEEAALRETWEETGLTGVTVAAYFGVQPQVMRADYHMVLRRVTLLQQPRADAPAVVQPFPTYLGLRRGLPVRRMGEEYNGYVKVAYEEFDAAAITSDAFDVPHRSVSGWVESDAVTPILLRHFFHVTTTEPTPDSWVQSAEEWEHRFELYWVPLRFPMTAVMGLIPSQAIWLTEYAERLL
jgi:8-oxo-dGTP pyrophosphatase MutT (NUDIX family)